MDNANAKTKIMLATPSKGSILIGKQNGEITIEHMTTLLESYRPLLAKTLGVDIAFVELNYDIADMLDFYNHFFSVERFELLFSEPEGKGYLFGFYTTMAGLRDGTTVGI